MAGELIGGDAGLMGEFLRHRDLILSYLQVLCRDPDAAEEVFQEVAIVLLEEDRRGTVVTEVVAFACEVARRRVQEHFRRRTRRRQREGMTSDRLATIAAVAMVEAAASDAASDQQRHRRQALASCQERLTGRAREVIDGRYRDQRSNREIAAALGWNESSVKVALSRARRVLADCIRSRLRSREEG